MGKTSCNQLLLIHSAKYIYAHQDWFTNCCSLAMGLYDIVYKYTATVLCTLLCVHTHVCVHVCVCVCMQ